MILKLLIYITVGIIIYGVITYAFYPDYFPLNPKKCCDEGTIEDDCAQFTKQSEKDQCCAFVHKDDIVIQCVGDWIYYEAERSCEYKCQDG